MATNLIRELSLLPNTPSSFSVASCFEKQVVGGQIESADYEPW